MTAPHALITGASIAGLSAAWWLRTIGWEVTVVERASSFRGGGQNVDVRGVAREVLDRMDLTDAIRAKNTTETGTVIVDADDRVIAELPSDGPDGATAELEVLRGDFARAILEDLPAGVRFVYGETVTEVDESRSDRVTVVTTAGQRLDADLLVVAEGVRSATRDLLFAESEVDADPLGITMAFGTIPRTADDDDRWRWYNAVGGRQVHLRPDPYGTIRAILSYAGEDDLVGRDRDDALRVLRERYADAGWRAERVLDGFDSSDDVYIDELTQIRMPGWHRGRVCVIGDAAWCVTPMGGGGASLALTGGYVLAAFLSQIEGRPDRDRLDEALASFDAWMRPLVDEIQGIPRGMLKLAYPHTRLGLAARSVVMKVMTTPPLSHLTAKVTQVADTDRELPEVRERACDGE
ncbi:FAD-dependent monooxygenase [Microbacterium testaceum]|uniref:FAD-dependent monooxygenase n=1 Tax=Microbacterium testaceum TaxID=2033 RepID=UPI0038068BB5